jgi:hypothetical protein
MNVRTMVLGAFAAVVVAAPCAALAQDWSGYGDNDGGGSAQALIEREGQFDHWIDRAAEDGRLDGWQSRRALNDLRAIQRDTMREARFHGDWLPGDDYRRISDRLGALRGYLQSAMGGWGYRHGGDDDDDE